MILGVNNQVYTLESVRRLIDLKKWIRMPIRNLIHPKPDVWDFSFLDVLVPFLGANGIPILGLIEYSGKWAHDPTKPWFPSQPMPSQYDDFLKFVFTVVERCPTVMHWQVLNEPNRAAFWPPAPDVREYIGVLKVGYRAIKVANPFAKVVIAGTSGIDVEWYKKLYAMDAMGFFDIAAVHSYNFTNNKTITGELNALSRFRSVMTANGDKSDVWLTEIGWNMDEMSEETQAILLSRTIVDLTKRDYVGGAFIYKLMDTPGSHFGLLDGEGNPRTAYSTLLNIL